MVDIKSTIKAICRAYPGGQKAMAAQLDMSYDKFRNHLDQKCSSRFFTLAEIERMEDLSGTTLLAEYYAARRGKLLVDIPMPEQLDNVELYEYAQREDVAKGELVRAQQEAVADGVICADELEALMPLFWAYMGYTAMRFYSYLALYGAPITSGATQLLKGKVAYRECRPCTPIARNSCVEIDA